MIERRSPREIELMRTAGKIVAIAHREVATILKPGISLKEVDAFVDKLICEHGATPSFKGYGGFPAATCLSVNDVVVHGIPDATLLKDGDIISIDIGACYQGYHGDSAWSYAIGKISDEDKHLLEVTEQALMESLKAVKSGNMVSDVSKVIQTCVESQGLSIVKEFTGHGVGRELHEDPIVFNYYEPLEDAKLLSGMTIAIEPIVAVGRPSTYTLSDQWTVKTKSGNRTAHFEHTVLVTEDGCEILTKI
ncbi:MAG: type I methionyl aminopeptidase [Culicoidibacterales bacterium]